MEQLTTQELFAISGGYDIYELGYDIGYGVGYVLGGGAGRDLGSWIFYKLH